MKSVYAIADTIVSPLGFSTAANVAALRKNQTGITKVVDTSIHEHPFFGALIEKTALNAARKGIIEGDQYTKLEQMLLLAIAQLNREQAALDIQKCGVIISTTKGNIDTLRGTATEKSYLTSIAHTIQDFFKLPTLPVIISNACISGGLAIAVAKRMMQAGRYEDMIVVGGDLLSEFTLSGFFSFQAVSDAPCKPFCKHRTGISLGEAAAALWLSSRESLVSENTAVRITGEASINDANHISGPSRTGEGLYRSITNALQEAGVTPDQIDYISSHGTATPYNDEMEAIAFNRIGLQNVPVNSLKGYYGHTLGASALLETILAKQCLLNNEVYASLGFEELGVTPPIAILKENKEIPVQRVLKTASGFGGCNVALILEKGLA